MNKRTWSGLVRRLVDIEERVTALDEVGDLSAAPGSRPWAVAVRDELRASVNDTKSKAEHLQSWRDAMVRYEGWRQLSDERGRPFASFRAFCQARPPFGLGYRPEFIDALICKKSAEEWAADHGEIDTAVHAGPGRGRKTPSDTRGLGDRVDANYLTARIARDRPDILALMRAGKFSSVRAAALEAGILKPRVSVERTPSGFARAVRRYLPGHVEELVALLRAVP